MVKINLKSIPNGLLLRLVALLLHTRGELIILPVLPWEPDGSGSQEERGGLTQCRADPDGAG
jgi:hypothetical protein